MLGPRAPPAAEQPWRGAGEERGAAGAQGRGGLGGGPGRPASCQEARAGAGLALRLPRGRRRERLSARPATCAAKFEGWAAAGGCSESRQV